MQHDGERPNDENNWDDNIDGGGNMMARDQMLAPMA